MTAEERQKVKEARAAYAREWRKKNPGKNKEYVDRYWENRIKRKWRNRTVPDTKKLKVAPNDFLTEYEIKYFEDAKNHALWLFQKKFLTPREFNMICNRINREKLLIVRQREKEEEENE